MTTENITPEILVKTINDRSDETKRIAEQALTEAKNSGTVTAETKAAADKALTELAGLRAEFGDLVQKMSTNGGDDTEAKSYGQQFVESDTYKNHSGDGASLKMRVAFDGGMRAKAVTSAAAATAYSARETAITGLPMQRLQVRDLLTVIPTTSGSIDYPKQTTRTNSAAPVAEQAAKPYSDYAYTIATVPVRVIAHLAKITRQAMDDAVQLQGEIDMEMRYGLALVEDGQLLNGSGTGQNLSGLITNATAYAAPAGSPTATTNIDTLRLALLQVELADYTTDGIVLNPIDWARIELIKDADGRYIWSNPQQVGAPRMWGQPVVSTKSMTVDKFLVGNFKAQTLYDRMAPEVLISSENADDFEKNLYTMRCEERIALAVKRGAALSYGDFGNVA